MADATLDLEVRESGAAAAERAVRGVDTAMQGAHASAVAMGAVMGVVSSATGALTNTLMQLAGAAVGALKSSLVDLNSSLEQNKIAFTTMLGSGEAADAFLKELAQFARDTPFELPGLVQASQKLLAFGFSANQVKPLLTAVGDAAAGLNLGQDGINRATMALGQMQAKGKVTAEEMMQLNELGIGSWKMLAAEIGTDVPTAMDRVSKGIVSSDTMMRAFINGSASQFGGLMEKQSHTWQGAISNIIDSLGQATSKGLKPFFDLLSTGAQTVAEFLGGDQFAGWASAFGEAMTGAASQLGSFISDAGPRLLEFLGQVKENVGGAISAVQGVFEPIMPVIEQVGGAVANFESTYLQTLIAAIRGVGETIGDLVSGFGMLTGTFQSTEGDVNVVAAAFDAMSGIMATVRDTWAYAWQSMRIVVTDMWNATQPIRDQIVLWLSQDLPPILDAIKSNWDGFWGTAGPLLQAFWEAAKPVLGDLAALLGAGLVLALQGLQKAWDAVFNGLKTAVGFVADVLGKVGDVVGPWAKELAEGLTTALRNATPVAVAQAEETGEAVKNAIVQGAVPAVEEVGAATEEVGQKAAAASTGVNLFGNAVTSTAASSKEAKTALDQFNSSVSEWLKSTDPAIVAAGQWAKQVEEYTTKLAAATPALSAEITAVKNLGDVEQMITEVMRVENLTRDEAIAKIQAETMARGQNAQTIRLEGAAAEQKIDALVAEAAATREYQQRTKGLTAEQQDYYRAVSQVLGQEEALRQLRARRGPGGTISIAGAGVGAGAGAPATAGALQALHAQAPAIGKAMAHGFRNNVGSGPEEFGREIGAGFNQAAQSVLAAASDQITQALARFGADPKGEAFPGMTALIKAGFEDLALTLFNQLERIEFAGARGGGGVSALEQATAGRFVNPSVTAGGPNPFLPAAPTGRIAIDPSDITRLGQAAEGTARAVGGVTRAADDMGQALVRASYDGAGAVEQIKGGMYDIGAAADATIARVQKAVATALRAGQMVIAGQTTATGLTTAQIYGATATGGGQPPIGNVYGLPILPGSPITKGTLYGFDQGATITRPTYLTDAATLRTYGVMAERRPETIGPAGGNITASFTFYVTGSDMFDERRAERMLDGALGRVLEKRGYRRN